jgi:RecA/RadA recombinase
MAKELTLAQQQADRKERAKNLARDMSKDGIKINYASSLKDKGRQLFGIAALDKLTNGGIPKGKVTTLYGEKSSGKSTIALKMIATAQKEGKTCLYVDMERGYSVDWAEKQGVDTSSLLYASCVYAEQACDVIIQYCKEKIIDFAIIDSIHGLCPRGEMYDKKTKEMKSVEDDTQALLARKLGQFFRMAIPYISDADCAMLLIGQTRTKLGGYVAIEGLSGGASLHHNSRLIIHCWSGKGEDAPTIKEVTTLPKINEEGDVELDKEGNPKLVKKTKEVKIGFSFVAKVDKSQILGCPPLSEVRVPFYFATGFDKPIEETKVEPIIPNVKEVLKESIEISKQLEEVSGLPTESKKKRGRPATKDK